MVVSVSIVGEGSSTGSVDGFHEEMSEQFIVSMETKASLSLILNC